MSEYYSVEEIKRALERNKEEAEALLGAWKAVTFPTKKDGKPFAVMSKNIKGAKYYLPEFAMQSGQYEIKVTAWTVSNRCVSSSLNAYLLVKYLTDENMKAKTQNYQPKQTYLEQVYTYDLDDIKKVIEEEICRLKEKVSALKEQEKVVDVAYTNFKNAFTQALDRLKIDAMKSKHCGLYYDILDTVKKIEKYH